MREIKFRAWDKDVKSMSLASTITEWMWASYIQENKSQLVKSYYQKLIWMQYTGLKDKNGKDIYEGDIIVGQLVTGFIDFRNGMFVGVWKKGAWQDDIEHIHYPIVDNHFEVIGNIYENPELIKKSWTK